MAGWAPTTVEVVTTFVDRLRILEITAVVVLGHEEVLVVRRHLHRLGVLGLTGVGHDRGLGGVAVVIGEDVVGRPVGNEYLASVWRFEPGRWVPSRYRW